MAKNEFYSAPADATRTRKDDTFVVSAAEKKTPMEEKKYMQADIKQMTIPKKESRMKELMAIYRKTGKVGTRVAKNPQHAQRLAAEMAVSELGDI